MPSRKSLTPKDTRGRLEAEAVAFEIQGEIALGDGAAKQEAVLRL